MSSFDQMDPDDYETPPRQPMKPREAWCLLAVIACLFLFAVACCWFAFGATDKFLERFLQ